MTHVWHWRQRLPGRKGMPCRILARGKMNSILVEFEDGTQVITSRYAVRVRKIPPETPALASGSTGPRQS